MAGACTAPVRIGRGTLVLAGVLGLPTACWAHVKWFATYDVTARPKPISAMATSTFFAVLAVAVTLLFLGSLLDGWATKRYPILKSAGASSIERNEKWVRLGMGAYLLCQWAIGLNILTPELLTQTPWVFTVQFLSAFCIAWRRTCVLSALGICVLYVYGITQYGMFHMLDYVYFPGLAVFLAGVTFARLSRVRVTAMIGSLAFSIMWTAIEKLAYPQWTAQVLVKHSHMAMGLPVAPFIVIAAFVEFTLAFYLATGRGMLRLGGLVLLLIFIAAMPEFGRRDVVGHLPLVAILGVPLIAGHSALQRFWRLPGRGIAVNAAMVCVLYTLSLSLFFLAYYGVQWLEYPHVSG